MTRCTSLTVLAKQAPLLAPSMAVSSPLQERFDFEFSQWNYLPMLSAFQLLVYSIRYC